MRFELRSPFDKRMGEVEVAPVPDHTPWVLSWFVIAAGVGYVVDSLASLLVEGYGGAAAVVALTPTVIGEVGLTLWFLIRGVAQRR